MTSEFGMEYAMARHAAQNTLFCAKPSRPDILGLSLPKAGVTHVTVNVWRNHNFETLSALIEPYSLFGRWLPTWNVGAYDDSLMFDGWRPAAAELLWFDAERVGSSVSGDSWLSWLGERLKELRARSHAPILLATWTPPAIDGGTLQAVCERLPAVEFLDLRQLSNADGIELLNARTSSLTGSPVSKAAQLVIARELACRALPAILFPPIKGVALDLDETLHAGVLAEDGVAGVQLTEPHRELQQYVRQLRERGIYLCLVSRNELRDVERLFEARTDYPLRIQDFSAIEVSWDPKSTALRRVAERLRIAVDALLFVDDNAGELAEVAATLPALHTLHAQPGAELTLSALRYYPGLWRFRAGGADKLRVADLHANAEREALATRVNDPAEYFRSLQVKLRFRYNPADQLERLAELSLKTNQFNLALKRWGVAKLCEYLSLPDADIVSVQMQDRLSDSGVIALVCARRQDRVLRVEELCISCRALGRRLEHSIVLLALRGMSGYQACTHVVFEAALGPRNQPARRWLAEAIGLADVPQGSYEVSAAYVDGFAAPDGVTVESSIHELGHGGS